MSKPIIFFITIIVLTMNTYFLGLKITIISFAAVLTVTYLFYLLCLNKIDGLTGDTLGACNELGEITFLLALLATIH